MASAALNPRVDSTAVAYRYGPAALQPEVRTAQLAARWIGRSGRANLPRPEWTESSAVRRRNDRPARVNWSPPSRTRIDWLGPASPLWAGPSELPVQPERKRPAELLVRAELERPPQDSIEQAEREAARRTVPQQRRAQAPRGAWARRPPQWWLVRRPSAVAPRTWRARPAEEPTLAPGQVPRRRRPQAEHRTLEAPAPRDCFDATARSPRTGSPRPGGRRAPTRSAPRLS